MAPFMQDLAPRLKEASGAEVRVHPVENRFFGDSVTVAGLLAGRDLLEAVDHPVPEDIVLVPGEALNADDLFIDSMPLGELKAELAPAVVQPGLDLIDALRRL
jgi:NifB/MoaA-like Fe-S oxidoreductase